MGDEDKDLDTGYESYTPGGFFDIDDSVCLADPSLYGGDGN